MKGSPAMNEKINIASVSAADLAYLGDSVLEVMVREHLVKKGHSKKEHLSFLALAFVTATAQSNAFENIEELLTEEELDVYKRGRNNYHTGNVPKSATPLEYRRATGFEALLGYLYLTGRKERLEMLFKEAYNI